MTAWIDGQEADIAAAVQAAAERLAPARAPVIVGLSADVEAVRAALKLGTRLGASIDPAAADHLYADLSVLAGSGILSTAPSQAVMRADVVFVVGERAAQSPLLSEVEATVPDVGRAAGARAIVLLGETAPPGSNIRTGFATGAGGLPAALGVLRALLAGRLAADHALSPLAERLGAGQFGVALYDPAELGELAVEMLHNLARDLSETTRFFALPVRDPWQGQSVLQVSAWTTGQAPRIGFGRGRPEHDPWRFDAARQAAAGEIDAALWLASLPAPQPPWMRSVPSVALTGDPKGNEADVVLAVAVPGETAGGVLWDGRRGTLTFHPARQPLGAEVPRADAILAAIEESVMQLRGPAC